MCVIRRNGPPPLSLPVLRVPAGSVFEGVLASPKPLIVGQHWFGKPVLCPGEQCEACACQSPRAVAVFAVRLLAKNGTQPLCLVEAPESAFFHAEKRAVGHGGSVAAGMLVRLSRRKKRAGLAIEFQMDGALPCSNPLSLEHLVQCLSVLYRLPRPAELESAEDWAVRVVPAVQTQVCAAIASMRSSG